MPGSPTIITNCPSPAWARSQRRARTPSVLFAADERSEQPGALPAASAAYAQYPIERHWRRDALELVRALVLDDEEPGGLPLDGRR